MSARRKSGLRAWDLVSWPTRGPDGQRVSYLGLVLARGDGRKAPKTSFRILFDRCAERWVGENELFLARPWIGRPLAKLEPTPAVRRAVFLLQHGWEIRAARTAPLQLVLPGRDGIAAAIPLHFLTLDALLRRRLVSFNLKTGRAGRPTLTSLGMLA